MFRSRVLAGALALAALSLLAAPPAAAQEDGPALPACRAGDVEAPRAGLQDWAWTVLDPEHRLPEGYAPTDLVPVSDAAIPGTGEVRHIVLDDLAEMARAAEGAGAPFAVHSAYRSYADQQAVLESLVRAIGPERAAAVSALPGHSEHQLGTAVDLRSADDARTPWQYDDWGATAAGTWLGENAWRHGFVLSYPVGAEARTCYEAESWHFRYVGRERAARVQASGLSLREYLWRSAHGTLAPPRLAFAGPLLQSAR